MVELGVITINVDPTIEVGPLSVAWHGLMIAVGLVIGGWLATRYAREKGLEAETVLNTVLVIALAGIVGARFLYLVQNDAGALLRPGDWLGTRGFSFYGAVILGTAAVGLYLWRNGLSARYLDALAAGFPLGMAVGRIGDIINGEHYGPETTLPWGFRYTSPHAEVPSSIHAYHSGGFYEMVLALVMLAIIWPLRNRFRHPTMLLWTVVALYSAGRFVMFFYRNDSQTLALGLKEAQWISLALLAVATAAFFWLARRPSEGKPASVRDSERAKTGAPA